MDKTKTILVTGATAGLGRHGALHLARAGHHVIATGRNQAALSSLASEAASEKLHLDVLQLDVTDGESIALAVARAERLTDGRGIDVLINNAGFGTAAPVTEMTDADVRAQYETNVFGLLAVTRAFLPQLRARSGRVVNVSSVGGRVAAPMLGVYTSTKFAVEALSDAMRVELQPFGVEVAVIEPGPIQSNFSERTIAAGYVARGGEWGPIYRRYEELRKSSDKMAADPIVVSRAMLHAAVARRPRVRYVVPFTSHFLILLGWLMPTRLMDFAMRRLAGFTASRLAAKQHETLTAPTA